MVMQYPVIKLAFAEPSMCPNFYDISGILLQLHFTND